MLSQSSMKKFQSMTFNEIMQLSFNALKDGRVLAKFRQMVVAQGGDPTCTIDQPDSYHTYHPNQP
jgi:thymidine phosphorylase